jgi:hypothetical protein
VDVPAFDMSDLGARWWTPTEAEAARFDAELQSEIPADHPLADVTTVPVAVKKLLKDWIVWLPDQRLWAALHLTYTHETDARWPTVTFAPTWPELLAEVL